jgi:hypothetical protein
MQVILSRIPLTMGDMRNIQRAIPDCGSVIRRTMSANKPEFDSTRLLPLTVVPPQLTPPASARRFKRRPERTVVLQPLAYLNVQVDGRQTSYFEWLGAGIYSADWLGASQNGRPKVLRELHYGFSERFFYLCVDTFPGSLSELRDFEFRITLRGSDELLLLVAIEESRFAGCLLDTEELCILGPHELVEVAFDKILEVALGRRLIVLAGQTSLTLQVAIWHAGLLLDLLPHEISLEVKLGADAFSWPVQ